MESDTWPHAGSSNWLKRQRTFHFFRQRRISLWLKFLTYNMSPRGWKTKRIGYKSRFNLKKGFVSFLRRLNPKNFFLLFKTKQGRKKLLIYSGVFLGFIFLLFALFAGDLPTPSKINKRLVTESTQIFDRNNNLLYQIHGEKNRTVIESKDMPLYLKQATIAVEDRNFYTHHGFDVRSILRAFLFNLFSKDKSQGGSTITQQLVKNVLLTSEKSFIRKIKEFILSIEVEIIYPKDTILTMYLNEIPYGSNAYGIQAAAKTFFGKDAKDLDLTESALLVALPKAPTYYSPYGAHQDELLNRKNLVLDLMAKQGYITQDQSEAAKSKKLAFVNQGEYAGIPAPHFVMYVKEKLVEKYGEKMVNEGGLRVYTTIDMSKQKMAEEAISEYGEKNYYNYNASNAALVSMDPKTGQILAMVGSRDYTNKDIDGFVNVATADRQPGSSFKPFAYATAWKKNYGPGTTLYDLETDFGNGYKPQNYSGITYGAQSMRTALDGSLNISAVKTLYLAGVDDTIDTAHQAGITTLNEKDRYGLSLVLGGGEVKLADMVAGYGVFANQGKRNPATWFLKITDSKGKVVDEFKKDEKEVLDPQIAYLISDVLSDDGSRAFIFGANGPLILPDRKVAAKTGTTNEWRDAWAMGYTPQLVTGVWAGNNNNTPMAAHADGSYVAAPIWNSYMRKALEGTPAEWYEKPSEIKTVSLDAITGKTPTNVTKQTRTDIFPSWYKPNQSSEAKQYKICKISHKLATDKCPAEAVEESSLGEVNCELDPNDPAYSRWQGVVAAWARGQGYTTAGSSIPTESCDIHTGVGLPTISFASPKNNETKNNPLEVKVNVSAPHGVSQVLVYVDGQEYQASYFSGSTYRALINTTAGSHQVKAKVKDNILYSAETGTIVVKVTGISLSLSYKSGNLVVKFSGGSLSKVDFWATDRSTKKQVAIGTDDTFSGNEYSYPFDSSSYSKAWATGSISGSSDAVTSNEISF